MPTHTGNPLVNAGAIATTSLISGKNEDEKWNKILDFYGKVAGEKLVLIDEVYKSEAATNAGNKALSMLLAKYDRIYADPFESVDIYTKQCSVGVNATQLARMGALLANNGKNPATGEQVIKVGRRALHPLHHDDGRTLRQLRFLGLACRTSRQERGRRRNRRHRSRQRCHRGIRSAPR